MTDRSEKREAEALVDNFQHSVWAHGFGGDAELQKPRIVSLVAKGLEGERGKFVRSECSCGHSDKSHVINGDECKFCDCLHFELKSGPAHQQRRRKGAGMAIESFLREAY